MASQPLSVYESDAAGVPVVSPFHLDTQPMRALVLFNFERDPDSVYKGLEPQAFDDDVHGRGLLVIGWRVDGRVDVFHDPHLRLDPATYSIAGDGLHRMEARDLTGGRVELGPAGALVDLGFTDLDDRPIRLVVRETDARPRRPFGLLAPMGSAATDPPALPLVYAKDFYFVRRSGSDIGIEIDGRKHRSDTLPLLLDGTWMHFVRYSATPFVALWNHSGHDTADVLPSTGDTAEAGGARYELRANGPFREIQRMSRDEGGQQVAVEFTPAFPQLLALRAGTKVDGSFRVSTEPPAGVVTGTWHVVRQGQRVEIEIVPSGGWTPGDAQPMARLLFRVIAVFRSWPTTYRWRGTVELPVPGEDLTGPIPLTSRWERVG
ncbi:MAG: hypothetical protein EA389_13065 [Ilumatobacter sp.]|nr:MAG: hypothetical protein EA389_13065 [Ilumatobacter sp.]